MATPVETSIVRWFLKLLVHRFEGQRVERARDQEPHHPRPLGQRLRAEGERDIHTELLGPEVGRHRGRAGNVETRGYKEALQTCGATEQ